MISPLHLDRQWTFAEMATAVEKICAELRRRLAENKEYDGPMVKYASLHLAMGSAEDLIADINALRSDRGWVLDDSERVRLANLPVKTTYIDPLATGKGDGSSREDAFTTLDEALGGLPSRAKKCGAAEYDEAAAAYAATSAEEES